MSDYIEVDGLRVGPYMWRNAKDELTRLQSEVERLRGRLNEINNLVALRWSNGVPTHSEMLEEVEQLSKPGTGSAWLLRKQAEAVEALADYHDEDCGYSECLSDPELVEFADGCVREMSTDDMRAYAQRLRQQAAESAGGEDAL